VVVVSALGFALGVRRFVRGAWDWLVAFSKTRLGRVVLVALAVAVALLVAFQLGQRSGVEREKSDEAQRRAAAVKVVTKVTAEGRKISTDVSTRLERRKVEIRTVTQTLTKEVPVYVTVESDRACVVPDGFVRLHDAAAHGTAVPAAPGGSVEAASGVPLSAVAETMVTNYGVALEWREEALAWRTWYARQADLWSKHIKAPDSEP
jgi:hypothetical protein